MLYGRGAMRELGIADRMGCDSLWAPRYNHELGSTADIGWPDASVMLWQYTDGKFDYAKPYPIEAPGIGATDLSVFVGGDIPDLKQNLLWYEPEAPAVAAAE
jgi:hypothetical protein